MSWLSPQLHIALANVIAGANLNVNRYACKTTPPQPIFPPRKIRRRAYELYVQRGSQAESELDDWLRAEAEILWAQDAAIDKASEESFPAVMRRPIKRVQGITAPPSAPATVAF